MTDIVKFIEGVKVSKGIKSDRQLAARVGISQASMTNIMGGFSVPKDETCLKIAELAGEDPTIVIALAHKSKASEATKKHWAKIFKAVAAASFSVLVLISTALPAQAGQITRIVGEYTLSDLFVI